MEIYSRFKTHDYESAGWGQLVEWMNDMLALRHKHWYWHYYALIATGTIFWDWVDISKELLGIDYYHPQFQKLMKGFDNRIFEADRQQFKLAQLIINSGLKDMFLETRTEEIIPNFEKSEKKLKKV